MAARLVLDPGQSTEKLFELKKGSTTLGRAKENDIVILDASLSRVHARIDVNNEGVVLNDLQSSNGTFVNGERISTYILKHGDAIKCGDVVFQFREDLQILHEISSGVRKGFQDLLVAEKPRDKVSTSALKIKQKDFQERSKDKLQILLEVSELLSSPEDIDILLHKIVDFLFVIMDVDRVAILMVNDETGSLEPRITRSAVEVHEGETIYSRSIVNYVLQKSVSVISSDAREDPRFGDTQSIMRQSIRSSICVPLKTREKIIGVLYVDNVSIPMRFVAEDLEFLSVFGNQAAIAIENSKLYNKIEEDARTREQELISLVDDRTKNLQIEKEKAENAMAVAEEANKFKSQFLANMSHELRTPLNAIIGYSEMLQEESEELGVPDLKGDLQKIQAAGKHLLTLINDILDLSKIEAGKMELFLETFNLPGLLDEVVTTVSPLMKKNGNTIVYEPNKEVGKMHADVTRIRQVLFNLLSNAAKFTKDGTVKLEVNRSQEADENWITFRVSDNGIGMTQEQLSRLFQAFSQADSTTARKYGGTGLGLIISLRFCQMMGGTITVESEPDAGTTFTVKIPAQVQSPARPV
ncbi:MAG TPA: ATP-binding protein [Acidobacteriota bacterium]|nr:ATP-binding protein [Acidobacteriota bacterium]